MLPNQYREAFLTGDRPLPFDRIWSKFAAKVDDDWKSCLEHCDKNGVMVTILMILAMTIVVMLRVMTMIVTTSKMLRRRWRQP